MDSIRSILDWLSGNSRSLTEVQKKEIHQLLNSLKQQLNVQMSSSSREQVRQFSGMMSNTREINERKYKEISEKVDVKSANLECRIHRVTNLVNSETKHMNRKIDTITKEYDEQIKTLKDQIKKLETEKNQQELKVEDEKKEEEFDIDSLAKSLKDLMKSISSNSQQPPLNQVPPSFNPPHAPPMYNYAPPHQPYPSVTPNAAPPYYPPSHPIPLAYQPPFIPGRIDQPTRFTPPRPNLPTYPRYNQPQNVYKFTGNTNTQPVDKNANRGRGAYSQSRFVDPTLKQGANDMIGESHKKKYRSHHFPKKFENKSKEQALRSEPIGDKNAKSYQKSQFGNEQFRNNSGPRKAEYTRTQANRGKYKRYQHFERNRPHCTDDGADSDSSSTAFQSLNSLPTQSNVKGKPHDSPQASTSKNDSLNLVKLRYPSKTEAIQKRKDIHELFDLPGTCIGKDKQGFPITKVANCLADIYDFEEKYGACEVIRL